MNKELLFSTMRECAANVDGYLDSIIDTSDADVESVAQSMKYSLFAGGKRIRAFLVLEFCRLLGGKTEAALPFAAAIEMMHTFSLIHDDLPCMDDDDLRRGKPTNHMVYGEATALLAGDALALKLFGTAASNPHVTAENALAAVKLLSDASAEVGMVGGQIMDMYAEENEISLETLKKLYSKKTGCLIRASALLGCLAAGKCVDSPEAKAAATYADGIGLAFQIRDDVLDATGDVSKLGKTIGSDATNNKTTFLTFMTADEAMAEARRVTERAKTAAADLGGEILCDLADYLLERES